VSLLPWRSELPAYGFLCDQFKGDLRQRRLESRDLAYRKEVPALHRTVMSGSGTQWDAAQDLATEMMRRYAMIFSVDAPEPTRERQPA
jgi:hypothetical protein